MLCRRCQNARTRSRLDGFLARNGVDWPPLRVLVCDGCGSVLPAVDSTDRLLELLSRLAGLGLAPYGHFVLNSEEGGEDRAALGP